MLRFDLRDLRTRCRRSYHLLICLIVAGVGLCAGPGNAAVTTEPGPPPDPANISAQGAVLMDSFTGELLFAKNPDEILYPASTTKILTALLVIEAGDLDEEVVVEVSDTKVEPSALYIKPGQRITRRMMLYGIMLKSANDVSMALARSNAGSVEAFGKKMTARAKELGCTNSNFTNPHGLPDPKHTSTARDMARIARAAMAQPIFRSIVSTTTYEWSVDGTKSTLYNKNRLLKQFDGCTGLKTGYTRAAGQCLVSSAMREGREVISVVLRANRPGIWTDSTRLLTYGLALDGAGLDEEEAPTKTGVELSDRRAGPTTAAAEQAPSVQ